MSTELLNLLNHLWPFRHSLGHHEIRCDKCRRIAQLIQPPDTAGEPTMSEAEAYQPPTPDVIVEDRMDEAEELAREIWELPQHSNSWIKDVAALLRPHLVGERWTSEPAAPPATAPDEPWIDDAAKAIDEIKPSSAPAGTARESAQAFKKALVLEYNRTSTTLGFDDWLASQVAQLRQERDACRNHVNSILSGIHPDVERELLDEMWSKRCDEASRVGYETGMQAEREARERAESVLREARECAVGRSKQLEALPAEQFTQTKAGELQVWRWVVDHLALKS